MLIGVNKFLRKGAGEFSIKSIINVSRFAVNNWLNNSIIICFFIETLRAIVPSSSSSFGLYKINTLEHLRTIGATSKND